MKRRFLKLFTMFLICFSISSVYAIGYRYEKEAEILYSLGLYKGVSEIAYVPDLGSNLTREQAVVILTRLFGQQEHANKMTNLKINNALKKFVDAEDISSWAKKEVAYAISKGYIKGIEKDDGYYFNPRGHLKGLDYASLVLQQLNIQDFEYRKSIERLKEEGIISKEINFDKKEITRDDVVGMSYGVLKAKRDDGKTVIENLVDLGIVEREDAEKLGLVTTKKHVEEKEENKDEDTNKNEDKNMNENNQDTNKNEDNNINENTKISMKRSEGAVKLGQWTIYNGSREAISIDKIYLSANYGGNPYVLQPEYITGYSIEDTNGNVYATFSNISNTRQVNLQEPFIVNEMKGNVESKKDLLVYAKIDEDADYGGTIELFLGDGVNIFEGIGKITGTSVIKTGSRVQQEDGLVTIVMSEVIPSIGSYNVQPAGGSQLTVGAFYLQNKGPKGILMEKITLKEIFNTKENSNYILKNEKGKVISTAVSDGGEVVFDIQEGQKISAEKSELFKVEIADKLEKYDRVQLRLEKEGTSYDTLDNKGYEMNIDDGLTLDEVIVRD